MFPLDHALIMGTTTMTTELPTKLTVRYIVDNKSTAEGSPPADGATVEDPKKFLVENGVDVSEEDSEEDIKAAVVVLQDSTFWQKHSTLHPQQGRVKNWLWVHSRYRTQADAMLALEGDHSKQMVAFQKFHKKIESHSEFEDTQLFKFFVDNKIGNQETFQELIKQHGDIRLVTEINEGLEQCKSGSASEDDTKATKEKLTKYVEDLKAHLDLEEKTIVGPWLQLTPEQYKTYRSYLSWMYCFMY